MSEQTKVPSYSFSHITDVLQVPDDRLDECLDSMKQMIRAMRLVSTSALTLYQEDNNLVLTDVQKREYIRFHLPVLTWVDDGTDDSTVTNQGKTLLSITRSFPQQTENDRTKGGLVLYGDHLGDIRQWVSKQPGYADVDLFIFEERFNSVMGSQYKDCWRQIPDFYPIIICKTHDAIRYMPMNFTLARIGRSVRDSDRGQLLKTDIDFDTYMMLSHG